MSKAIQKKLPWYIHLLAFFILWFCAFNTVNAIGLPTNISVSEITARSAKITFDPLPSPGSLCEAEKEYKYVLYDAKNFAYYKPSEHKIIRTTFEGRPSFEIAPLSPDTEYKFLLQTEEQAVDWYQGKKCGSYLTHTTNTSTFSDPITVHTKKVTTTDPTYGFPSMQLQEFNYSPLLNNKDGGAHVNLLYTTYNEDGTKAKDQQKITLSYRYGDTHLSKLNLSTGYFGYNNEDANNGSPTLQLYLNKRNYQNKLFLSTYDNDTPILFDITSHTKNYGIKDIIRQVKNGDISPGSLDGVEVNKDRWMLLRDISSATVYVIKINTVSTFFAPPPIVHNVNYVWPEPMYIPTVTILEPSYAKQDIKKFSIQYTCVDCTTKKDKKTKMDRITDLQPNTIMGVTATYTFPSYEKYRGHVLKYRVKTTFTSGKSSTWSPWYVMKVDK